MKNKKRKNNSGGQRQTATKCASNLERLGSLYPNADQYSAELSKAYEKHGANFNASNFEHLQVSHFSSRIQSVTKYIFRSRVITQPML